MKLLKDETDAWVEPPIHGWFGLSYSNYFVAPRMMLQAMPLEWQQKFIALMDEAAELGVETPVYHVLRDDPAYTFVEKYDSEDDTSPDREFTILQQDPWGNYRYPDYNLLPEALNHET